MRDLWCYRFSPHPVLCARNAHIAAYDVTLCGMQGESPGDALENERAIYITVHLWIIFLKIAGDKIDFHYIYSLGLHSFDSLSNPACSTL